MAEFDLKIISPEKKLYDGKCESLVFDTPDGSYGIMAGHTPLTASVSEGEIKITFEGSRQSVIVKKGILHFENNSALIITG